MGDTSSPGSCLVWVIILFPSKFCISCLTNSVSTSLKEYWNEFVLGNEVILICIPFTVWRTSASEVSADHSV